ncbi:MAG: hypothetical protein COT88_00080 [Candidatus Colwellbacteria bacterium CG10_big_fil_rev_8_21_14_0_10_41_28]|uniref:DNA replication/recombination mediator RecO N-terminal domain-containing protein n=1 Tax=Candidatus Colwellbacteria bacterium CG10_big_fil_rev_8_21_14_0_10_41_28 TaxID=1974539 RepID=A0A2H0VHX0_9BACT|nr:MAG: hypothetical protein COT88_00080 [Candidatus Colwellbacteria bacterium CG10_big_fil_rev_8_21_14_0_10_41_28]
MTEHYLKAIILDRSSWGNQDVLLTLYTKELGKIRASSKSMRKITSKLSGQLPIGSLATVRLVDNGYLRLVDALKEEQFDLTDDTIKHLYFLDEVIPFNQPDRDLWYTIYEILRSGVITPRIYGHLLGLMGFIPQEGQLICQGCRANKVVYFDPRDIMFLCTNCSERGISDIEKYIKISD